MYKKQQSEPLNKSDGDVVSVANTPTRIVGARRHRTALLIQNQDTTPLYLGFTANTLTTSDNYFAVLKGGAAKRDGSGGAWSGGGDRDVYEGKVYGIRKSTTGNASYLDVYDDN